MKGVEFVEDSGAKTNNEEVSQGWVERWKCCCQHNFIGVEKIFKRGGTIMPNHERGTFNLIHTTFWGSIYYLYFINKKTEY